MATSLVAPTDSPERQREKLLLIADVLMRRVEQITDDGGAAYAQFQRAAMLEDQVGARTRDLEHALDLLNQANAQLAAANAEAEAARRNLADAIETVQEGFALFDPADVLVMCNSRFGMHMHDLRDHLRPGLHFADYVELVSRSQFLELPDSQSRAEWAVGRKRRHQDRHVIFNVRMIWDRWVQVSEHRTANGGTVILQTDVTDIIRIEREERGRMLDDQARLIRATLDHIGQGVCIFDAGGRLVGWNRRLGALLGIPPGRFRAGSGFAGLVARALDSLALSPGMTEGMLTDWAASGPGRADLYFELTGPTGLVLQAFAQEMPDAGFVISFADVTAERAAIAALSRANETLEARVAERTLKLAEALADAERANASRSRFVAAASHDLLQPLSAAKLFIASIGDKALDPGARGALSKAQNALDSVAGILGALLDISKLESGRAAVSVGPVALNRVLDPLRDEFTAIAAAKGLRLTVVACGAVVASDAAYLRRVLQNLIGNAVRYTDRGRVLVGARRLPGAVRIEVRDTGPGIAPADQQAIWREFHRLNAPASASEGMGLGLAIVERACGLLDHPLSLTSAPGQGACFAVTVPLAEQPAPQPPRNPVAPGALGDLIVMLVENDDGMRRALEHLLESWGAQVLQAASGDEALDLIDELGILPDALIVDQRLDTGTGTGFVEGLRARHGPLPALLVTADRSPATAARAAALDLAVLAKPVDTQRLHLWLAETAKGAPLTTKV